MLGNKFTLYFIVFLIIISAAVSTIQIIGNNAKQEVLQQRTIENLETEKRTNDATNNAPSNVDDARSWLCETFGSCD